MNQENVMIHSIDVLARSIWGDEINNEHFKTFFDGLASIVTVNNPGVYPAPSHATSQDALISSLDDIVFELDNDGVFLNAWVSDDSRLFMPRELFMYKKFTDVMPPPLCDILYEAFIKVKREMQPVEVEYPSPFSDQYFLARFNLVKRNNSKHHISVLIRDITEKKRGEQELMKAKEAAENALKTKSYFLSSISHEIRTPMNAIIGLTDILLEQEQEAEQLEYLRSIKHSSDNLLRLINDLLDFSKLEAGKIQFEQIDFELNKQLTELEKSFNKKISEKGIDFITVINLDVPPILNGDPYRLNQVLINLVSNAVKFTEKGYIKLSVTIKSRKENDIILLFKLEDTGIGIPENKQHEIFESFTQASVATTREYGGTGLGLAITKNIVEQQGGCIKLESEENKGSVFFIELPFKVSGLQTLIDPLTISHHQSLSHLRILVAEDNPMNQLVIKKTLEDWQADYDITRNGKELLKRLDTSEYDIILMDLQMPEMDGMEATHIIRSEKEGYIVDIPIIAFTADAFPETRVKVLESGMNDFITKPFDKNELYSKIVRYTNNLHR